MSIGISQIKIKDQIYDIEAPNVLAFDSHGMATKAFHFAECSQEDFSREEFFTRQPNTIYFVQDGPEKQCRIPVLQATGSILGGVCAAPRTELDTNEVHIDHSTGKLYVAPASTVTDTTISAKESYGYLSSLTIGTKTYKVPVSSITFSNEKTPNNELDLKTIHLGGTKWSVGLHSMVATELYEGSPSYKIAARVTTDMNALIISGWLGETGATGLAKNPDFCVVAAVDKLLSKDFFDPSKPTKIRYSVGVTQDDAYSLLLTFAIYYDSDNGYIHLTPIQRQWIHEDKAMQLVGGGISEIYAI